MRVIMSRFVGPSWTAELGWAWLIVPQIVAEIVITPLRLFLHEVYLARVRFFVVIVTSAAYIVGSIYVLRFVDPDNIYFGALPWYMGVVPVFLALWMFLIVYFVRVKIIKFFKIGVFRRGRIRYMTIAEWVDVSSGMVVVTYVLDIILKLSVLFVILGV